MQVTIKQLSRYNDRLSNNQLAWEWRQRLLNRVRQDKTLSFSDRIEAEVTILTRYNKWMDEISSM